MFWYLLLAHFLSDYPLQPNWIARNKHRFLPRKIHVLTHFAVMVLVSGQAAGLVWPYLAGIAIIHFFLDWGKILFARWKPDMITIPYLVDQSIHVLVLASFSVWIDRLYPFLPLPLWRGAMICLTAYVLVTHFWYISERILTYRDPAYQSEVIEQSLSRMLARAVYLTLFLYLGATFGALPVSMGAIILIPYRTREYRWRALLTDFFVTAAAGIFLMLII